MSVHHGGGVGMGYSLHAGMVVVADGSAEADEKLSRVLNTDPGMGIIVMPTPVMILRLRTAKNCGVRVPMLGI